MRIVMDIRKTKYFISVVENESFTKAAQKNYISQSAISQQIASLEEELEVELIDRNSKKLKITPCGRYYYEQCRNLMERLDTIVMKTRSIYQDQKIRIGYAGPLERDFVKPIATIIYEKFPYISVSFQKGTFVEIRDGLLNGYLDLIIGYQYDLAKLIQTKSLTIQSEPMGLLVSKKHPFSSKSEMPAADVAGVNLVMMSRDYGPMNYEHMIECCRADGYEPHIVEEVSTCDAMFLLLSFNKGAAFFPPGHENDFNQDLHFIRLTGTHHISKIDISWLANTSNACIPSVIQLIKEKFKVVL